MERKPVDEDDRQARARLLVGQAHTPAGKVHRALLPVCLIPATQVACLRRVSLRLAMRGETGSVRDELRGHGYRAIAVRMKRLQDLSSQPRADPVRPR